MLGGAVGRWTSTPSARRLLAALASLAPTLRLRLRLAEAPAASAAPLPRFACSAAVPTRVPSTLPARMLPLLAPVTVPMRTAEMPPMSAASLETPGRNGEGLGAGAGGGGGGGGGGAAAAAAVWRTRSM